MLLHLVELVVVSGEERTGVTTWTLVDIFDDGPCYADAVVRGSAPAQFIKEDEASLAEVVQDVGCFAHLTHERTVTY